MQNSDIKKVAIYIRVSTKEQEEMFGEKAQLSRIKSYIDSRADLELAGEEYIYRDLAVSGTLEIEERESMSALFDAIKYSETPPFDMLIVFKVDRFARKLTVLLDIIDRLRKYDVGFISTQESLDTDSPFGKAMLGMLGVFAELEKDMIQERTSLGRIESKKAGHRHYDVFGYKRDENNIPRVLEDEAELIQEIFEMHVVKRWTPAQIGNELSERKELIPRVRKHRGGHKKVKNHFFRREETVKDILRNEVYIGNFYYGKSKTVYDKKTDKKKSTPVPKEERILSEVKHERIIDDKTFRKAQELISKKTVGRKKTKSEYILSGLILCNDCKKKRSKDTGFSHWVGEVSKGTKKYKCTGRSSSKYQGEICTAMPLPKNDFEALILHFIKSFFADPRAIVKYLDKHGHLTHKQKFNRNKLKNAVDKHNKVLLQIENNKELFKSGDISKHEYYKDKKSFEQDLRIAKRKLIEAEKELEGIVDANRYSDSFLLVGKIMKEKLPKVFADKQKLKSLLHLLIEEIVIYSRKKRKNEKLPGRTKAGQRIPNKVIIKFRLPQDFLNELFEYEQLRQSEYIEAHRNIELSRLNDIINELESDLKNPKNKSNKSKKSKGGTASSSLRPVSSNRP